MAPNEDGVPTVDLQSTTARFRLKDHLLASGVVGDGVAPSCSALIMRARAFSTAFEPVTPPL
jgi:hypothetical protein